MLKFYEITNEEFKKVNEKQAQKGFENYGKYLNPADQYDWCDMALEELVDAVNYLVAEKERKQVVVDAVVEILISVRNGINYEKVNIAIDLLNSLINRKFEKNKL